MGRLPDVVFLRDTALLWVSRLPRPCALSGDRSATAAERDRLGAAPLEAGATSSFLIVGATALLAIIVDHVVLTARMPLLAAVGLVAVSLIPAIAVPGDVDVPGFVLLAVAILVLLRAETRSRERSRRARGRARTAGVPATALRHRRDRRSSSPIVATPLLPQPPIGAARRRASAPGRRHRRDPAARRRSAAPAGGRGDARAHRPPAAPYLRAATLSRFDGAVWEPDGCARCRSTSELALGDVTVDPDIRVTEYTTTIEVTDLVSPWLPVPYPAVERDGPRRRLGGRALQPHGRQRSGVDQRADATRS